MLNRPNQEAVAHHPGPVTAGDTLVVDASDVAVFTRHGQLVRVLQPGQYTVPAEFAGDFEIYFVRTVSNVGEKLGGNLGLPNVRVAFGTFTWRITDPERVVTSLLGQDPSGLARFVAQRAFGELRRLAMRTPDAARLQREAADPINAKLATIGVQLVSIDELTLK